MMRRMGRFAGVAIACAACGSSRTDAPPATRAPIDAAAPAAPAAALTLVGCTPTPLTPGASVPTIRHGAYGVIGGGHQSGYGVGGGGRHYADDSFVPDVRLGPTPTVTGDLDPAIVRRYLKRNIQKVLYCYEKQLLSRATIRGTMTATFTIAPNGTVSDARADGVDPELGRCVADVIHAIEFPKPRSGAEVRVSYPLEFAPPAGADEANDPDEPPPPPSPIGTPWVPTLPIGDGLAPDVDRALAAATRSAVAARLAGADACARSSRSAPITTARRWWSAGSATPPSRTASPGGSRSSTSPAPTSRPAA